MIDQTAEQPAAQGAQPQFQQQQVPAQGPADVVHFLDYWQILYSRKEIVIAVSILLILVGIVVTRRMPKVYAALAVIEVQRETPTINLYGHIQGRYDPIFLRTQFEIIKSDPVIEQVVRESNLDQELGMEYGWRATSSAQDTFERTVALVKRKTNLSIFRDTDLIAIQVKLERPEKPEGEAAKVAARVANTIAQVFRSYTREKTKGQIEEGLVKLGEEVKDLERQIAIKEDEFRTIRDRHGVTLLGQGDVGAESVRRRIAEFSSKAENAKMQAAAKRSRYERIVELSPAEAATSIFYLTGDSTITPLLSDQTQGELRLAQLESAGFGEQHPEVVQTKTALEGIASKIRSRVDEIKNGLRLDWEQAQDEARMYEEQVKTLADIERKTSSGVSIELEKLSKDIETLKARRAQIENRMDDERIGLDLPKTSVEIIQAAKVPEIPLPVSPNFALNVTLSVAAGLFFGVVLAFFVEYLDTTVKTAEDVERFLQSTVIGIVPQKLRSLNSPNARLTHYEVYRVLRMNLKNNKALGGGKSILLTSASAGEGKSLNAFNLAWIYAECGERTLLLDADLYHPRQHRTLGTSLQPGLANIVVGEATLDSSLVHTSQPNLDFLPAGRIASASVFGLMDTEEMAELFAEIKKRYDRVIVDAPPMIGVSDTAQLVRLCDGVILVVHHRKYPRALCRRAKERVVAMGGNFLGVVLNNVNAAHGSSSYYYEHQYYYYTSDMDGMSRRRRRQATVQAVAASKQGGEAAAKPPAKA